MMQQKEMCIRDRTYPPISFKLTITGTEELTYRIEERSAFEVAGVSMLLDKSLEKNFCTVPPVSYTHLVAMIDFLKILFFITSKS